MLGIGIKTWELELGTWDLKKCENWVSQSNDMATLAFLFSLLGYRPIDVTPYTLNYKDFFIQLKVTFKSNLKNKIKRIC